MMKIKPTKKQKVIAKIADEYHKRYGKILVEEVAETLHYLKSKPFPVIIVYLEILLIAIFKALALANSKKQAISTFKDLFKRITKEEL